jgi:thiol-disulfide isomerase/thioredoxin
MVIKKLLLLGSIAAIILFNSSQADATVTVYDFGASWCGPCREDIVRDNALQAELGENVHFIFVDEDVELDKGAAFINSAHPNFEVRKDPTHALAKSMGAVNKTPSAVIVGSKGEKEVINGSLSKDALKSKIQSHQ